MGSHARAHTHHTLFPSLHFVSPLLFLFAVNAVDHVAVALLAPNCLAKNVAGTYIAARRDDKTRAIKFIPPPGLGLFHFKLALASFAEVESQ